MRVVFPSFLAVRLSLFTFLACSCQAKNWYKATFLSCLRQFSVMPWFITKVRQSLQVSWHFNLQLQPLGSLTTQPDLVTTLGAELSFSRGTSTFKLVLLGLLTNTACLTGNHWCYIFACLGCGTLPLCGLTSILFLINSLPVSVCIM